MIRALTLALALAAAPALAADDPAAAAAQSYTLDTSASTSSASVGAAGKLVLQIKPTAAGWHVHPQAPLKIKFEAPAALGLQKADLGRKDAVDPKAEAPRFEAPFVPAAAGAQQAKANVEFFICSDTACVRQVRTVPFAVAVK